MWRVVGQWAVCRLLVTGDPVNGGRLPHWAAKNQRQRIKENNKAGERAGGGGKRLLSSRGRSSGMAASRMAGNRQENKLIGIFLSMAASNASRLLRRQ